MAKTLIGLSGTGRGAAYTDFEGIVLGDGQALAQISEAIGVPTVDYKAGAVTEMTIPLVDDGSIRKTGLLKAGSWLRYDGVRWDIAAVEREYRGTSVNVTLTARSALARRLRNTTGPQTWRDITPAQWIRNVVKKAGGEAVAENGSKARKIVMKRGQSVLDVIASLASDTSVEWTEHGGVVYYGTPWWAYTGAPKLPTWGLSQFGEEAQILTVSTRSSLDDRETEAEASLTVPQSVAKQIRPWHRVVLSGMTEDDNGLWLVRDVNYELRPGAGSITCYRPKKSSPKNGSSSSGSSAGDDEDLSPVPGSTFTDAPRPNGWKGRTVVQILTTWRRYKTTGLPGAGGIIDTCLYTSQEIAGYSHVGDNPNELWPTIPEAKKHRNRKPVPGAILIFTGGKSGHAAVYMGNGRALSTDMSTSGKYVPGQWCIGPADKIAGSFSKTYVGWYEP